MNRNEALEKIKNLSRKDFLKLPYPQLVSIIRNLTAEEIILLSNKIGYPVFARRCMGELAHKFVLLQDGVPQSL